MSDPKRVLEETDDEFERALLRSVQRDGMTVGSRRRLLAGLGIAGALVTTSSTAASSAAAGNAGIFKGLTGVVAKWVAVSAIASLVPAGMWMARTHLRAPEVVTTSVATPPPSEPRPAAKEQKAALPVATEIAPVAKPSSPLRETRREAPPQAAAPSLSDEVAALQVARTALSAHDAGGAIAALDRYKSRFPAGRLTPEATVLRIDALVERGDRAQATALAERFESANPKSPYAERVRSILNRSKAPAKDPGAR